MPHVSLGSAACGSVPAMNHSSTEFLSDVAKPVNGSIFVRTRPSGRLKFVSGHFAVASLRKPCQTYVATSMEKSGDRAVETRLLSELPFQTPTASAYAPSFRPASVGGAM